MAPSPIFPTQLLGKGMRDRSVGATPPPTFLKFSCSGRALTILEQFLGLNAAPAPLPRDVLCPNTHTSKLLVRCGDCFEVVFYHPPSPPDQALAGRCSGSPPSPPSALMGDLEHGLEFSGRGHPASHTDHHCARKG